MVLCQCFSGESDSVPEPQKYNPKQVKSRDHKPAPKGVPSSSPEKPDPTNVPEEKDTLKRFGIKLYPDPVASIDLRSGDTKKSNFARGDGQKNSFPNRGKSVSPQQTTPTNTSPKSICSPVRRIPDPSSAEDRAPPPRDPCACQVHPSQPPEKVVQPVDSQRKTSQGKATKSKPAKKAPTKKGPLALFPAYDQKPAINRSVHKSKSSLQIAFTKNDCELAVFYKEHPEYELESRDFVVPSKNLMDCDPAPRKTVRLSSSTELTEYAQEAVGEIVAAANVYLKESGLFDFKDSLDRSPDGARKNSEMSGAQNASSRSPGPGPGKSPPGRFSEKKSGPFVPEARRNSEKDEMRSLLA